MVPSFHNLDLLERFYELYLTHPEELDPSWKYFFDGWHMAKSLSQPAKKEEGGDAFRLVEAYRAYGHLIASFNPLDRSTPQLPPQLDLKTYSFKETDIVPSYGFFPEKTVAVSKLVQALRQVYCGHIGFEYAEVPPEIEKWIQSQIEPKLQVSFDKTQRKKLLHDLNRAELFETCLHTKYIGQKRFSIEGGETVIPMLASLLEEAANLGVSETIIGMAHRGRLNVLANILEKSYAHIFHEFEDHYSPDMSEGTGDVKYHKGFEAVAHGMRIMLAANPSHLESVDPVVEGGAKASQVYKGQKPSQVLPLLIHGDASIAGQGVVYETLQLCRLPGYSTGGTLHVILNNQIGFTTLPKESRSTRYCTDIAKAFSAPVFHVNGEDPESCAAVALLAIRLRQKFGCDVFIDLNCYRKYGHNEGDEPTFTQPMEYRDIRSKKPVRELYLEKLLAEQHLSQEEASQMEEEFKQNLAKALVEAKAPTHELHPPKPKAALASPVKTAVPEQKLRSLLSELAAAPPGFVIHPKIHKLFLERIESPTFDWASAETLSFATLLEEGIHIRISGQDSRRGTFSHRHAVLVDQQKEGKYFPLAHLKGKKALFDVYNSPLSEFAVLGFEFGYGLEAKNSLVIWEAQYGDFVNGAQIVTDQYIAASEQKWGIASNLTLFLPHGYEGGGPEHSSGRMERFLQLSAEGNMRVANVTTPAQLFHLLRRQGLDPTKKPLILFTPKTLRHPMLVSRPEEFEKGEFRPILDDPLSPKDPETLIFCTGKISFDLFIEREKRKRENDYAIVRIEMLHPFEESKAKELMAKYTKAKRILWVQEEHANMGAYQFLRPRLEKLLEGKQLLYVGRGESASTAAGSYKLHKQQHESILQRVFA